MAGPTCGTSDAPFACQPPEPTSSTLDDVSPWQHAARLGLVLRRAGRVYILSGNPHPRGVPVQRFSTLAAVEHFLRLIQ